MEGRRKENDEAGGFKSDWAAPAAFSCGTGFSYRNCCLAKQWESYLHCYTKEEKLKEWKTTIKMNVIK